MIRLRQLNPETAPAQMSTTWDGHGDSTVTL